MRERAIEVMLPDFADGARSWICPSIRLVCALLLAMLSTAEAAAQLAPPELPATARLSPDAERAIEAVRGNLYRARNANWNTVFLVTTEGIILGDPISNAFATWLKDELEQRFPGKPVAYVVYSHSHWDHAEGGAVFADTAHFVGHENMLSELDGRVPQLPGDILDRNDNGVLELAELREQSMCGTGDGWHLDRNGDGIVTMAELSADIRRPDIVYSDRMTLILGDGRVELLHPGRNHSVDATVMYFPAQRAVFATEFIVDAATTGGSRAWPAACGTVPGFDSTPLADWIGSIRAVEALDFDVLIPGHQNILLTPADVAEGRELYEDLVAAVSMGMSQGKSLEELTETLTFEKYRDWTGYAERRVRNIEAAYHNLRIYR